ncbi:MAG: FAD-dependent oxidoreductase [Trueperaceae bacterium]|nr:FAD-dependent oxidoreductase [Trueperaceae bacterium]
MTSDLDTLIVGAGIAGLTAAAELRAQGQRVLVVEKSHGLGGRAATRRRDGLRIDHGAQYVTVRDPRLQARVDGWLTNGDVAVWSHGVPSWDAAGGWRAPAADAHPRYVAPEGMSALAKLLGAGVPVEREARATAVRADGDGWSVGLADGSGRRSRSLILTPPVPQTLELLAGVALAEDDRAALASVRYAPSFAVMAGYPDVTLPDWPAIQLREHPVLSWIANDAGKRRRDPAAPASAVLVLHATAVYARARFDDPLDAVGDAMLAAAAEVVPWAGAPAWRDVHRWRYALAETPLPEPVRVLAPGLVAAGDGFGGARVEGAFVSGLAAAEAVSDPLG